MKHVARKRFGQHFLRDEGVLTAMVRAIDPRPQGLPLVEIGPGLGALTDALLQRVARLTVVELDRDLAARLRRRQELDVVEADALAVDFTALAAGLGGRVRVVGNLPYNVSTPLLFHLLQHRAVVDDQHFMLQKEVVDRMAAAPGSKAYGRLSVMLQWCCEVEALFDVPPSAFEPPPRVDSAVVRLVPRSDEATAGVDAALLGELVTVAFSQRRKLLRHSLGHWLQQHGCSPAFDLQRRAEEVAVDDYLALTRDVAEALRPR